MASSKNDLASVVLERLEVAEEPIGEDGGCGAAGDDWGEVNRYFNQGVGYATAGQAVHANDPLPGTYRICFVNDGTGVLAGAADLDITFTGPRLGTDLRQRAYSVSNMKFFADLAGNMAPGQLTKLTTAQILSMANAGLDQFASLVLADDPFPLTAPTEAQRTAWAAKLKGYAQRGGNLVLTDRAMRALGNMGLLAPDKVEKQLAYAGYIAFTADDGATETYADPLAARIDQPGAAEGSGHRHQTYEPVPIGFAIQDANGGDANQSPIWTVDQAAWEAAGGRTVGTVGEGRVALGELPHGLGTVRVIGALLPMPTEAFDHPFGLANYALTYSGYQVLNNALQVERADLELRSSDIFLTIPSPREGQKPTIKLKLHNVGTEDVTSVVVRYYANGNVIGQNRLVVTVPAGSYRDIFRTWDTTGYRGQVQIVVRADPDGAIPELDETNNRATKTVTVRP